MMSETSFTLSPAGLASMDVLIERYPTKASALMPCIWVVMDEVGYVPAEAVDVLVEKLEVSRARVYELLSFYTMFRAEPQAEHTLQVCHNISCHIMGARPLIAHIEKAWAFVLGNGRQIMSLPSKVWNASALVAWVRVCSWANTCTKI